MNTFAFTGYLKSGVLETTESYFREAQLEKS